VEKAFGRPGFAAEITRQYGVYQSDFKPCNTSADCAGLGEADSCARPRDASGDRSGRCVAGWWGICHGWSPYAVSEPAPVKPVERNGVTFYPGDLEGLMSLAYSVYMPKKFLSERCQKSASGIGFDANGRPTDAECSDMNPGSMHVITTNFLGLRQSGFVEDRIWDVQVWNQPVRAYQVTNADGGKLKEISKAEAVALLGGDTPEYAYNTKAARFFHVEMDLSDGAEARAARTSHVDQVDRYTRRDHYSYVLEADDNGRVLGGEWIGASRTAHPDFFWWPTGRPLGTLPLNLTYQDLKNLNDESAGVEISGKPQTTVLFQDEEVQSKWKYAVMGVSPDARLEVTATGTGNIDLYVRLGSKPSPYSFHCQSVRPTSQETCKLQAPAYGGSYYIGLRPRASSSVVTVTATLTP